MIRSGTPRVRREIRERVLAGKAHVQPSQNLHDWLDRPSFFEKRGTAIASVGSWVH